VFRMRIYLILLTRNDSSNLKSIRLQNNRIIKSSTAVIKPSFDEALHTWLIDNLK
jgi:hypothetical protein